MTNDRKFELGTIALLLAVCGTCGVLGAALAFWLIARTVTAAIVLLAWILPCALLLGVGTKWTDESTRPEVPKRD